MRTGKNTFITSSLGGYLECSVSHGVEHGNDFTYRVIARKDRSLLVISVLHHNGRIQESMQTAILCDRGISAHTAISNI